MHRNSNKKSIPCQIKFWKPTSFEVYFGLYDCLHGMKEIVRIGSPSQKGNDNLQKLIYHDNDNLTLKIYLSTVEL